MKSDSKSRKPPSAEAQLRCRARDPSRQSRMRFRSQNVSAATDVVVEIDAKKQEREPLMNARKVMWLGVVNEGI